MKIAILGSAPSSIQKAPFGDPSWQIWACSPGSYPHLGRIDEFWELHRWEPGVIGKPGTQKPWFTPEYCAWLATVPPVLWVADPEMLKACPRNAKRYPLEAMVAKYGSYVWTSSVAYMMAMAIERVLEGREVAAALAAVERSKPDYVEPTDTAAPPPDVIGLWGVDMAANEELYSGQRAACQRFIEILVSLGIEIYLPPESDLATPPPLYGFSETSHRAIKWLERRRELESRLAQTNAHAEQLRNQSFFIQGAIDDLDYMQKMWLFEGDETQAMQFGEIFKGAPKAQPIASVAAETVMNAQSAEAQRQPVATPPLTLVSTTEKA